MGIIIWLIVGGICGWLASLIVRTDAQQGVSWISSSGIVSAIAGLTVPAAASTAITIETFLYSLIGAIILIAIVNLIQLGSDR